MTPTVIALDVGTSSVKGAAVARDGAVLATASADYPTHHPHPTHVEQDPDDWWRACGEVTRALAAQHPPHALAVSGQMLGVTLCDATGRALRPCLTWLDTRSSAEARWLVRGGPRVGGYGLLSLPRFLPATRGAPNLAGRDPTSKLVWLRRHEPELWERARFALDVKDTLTLRATGRAVTSPDTAHATWLYDARPHREGWSPRLRRFAGLDRDILPEVLEPGTPVGPLLPDAARDLGLSPEVPVVVAPGDVVAAAQGVGATELGALHLSLGTSVLATAHVDRLTVDPFTGVGSYRAATPGRYLLIASQETGGASATWARRALGDPDTATLDAWLQQTTPGAGGLHFLPWLTGERVPLQDERLRGGWLGVGLEHDRPQLWRAVAEGICLNARWGLDALTRRAPRATSDLVLSGGLATSPVWCQLLADCLQRHVIRPAHPELAVVLGAARSAFRALGATPSWSTAPAERVSPDPALGPLYTEKLQALQRAQRRLRRWFRLHAR